MGVALVNTWSKGRSTVKLANATLVQTAIITFSMCFVQFVLPTPIREFVH